jgi:hypothetical protein
VFQSAAIGRNKAGQPLGLAPYAIETLDIDGDGKVEPLLLEKNHDLLQPRLTEDGTLYFIRRPYKPPGSNAPGLGDFLLDVVLLPYRLIRTVFLIFNFFSMMVSGQPLATTVANRQMQPQQNQLLSLWGQAIDTKRTMQKNRGEQAGALVPKDWELIARAKDGSEKALATNVLAFDVGPEGSVIYTNGSAVFWQQAGGSREKICEQQAIESIVCLS